MKRILITALALTATLSGTARAGVQQTEQQRRDQERQELEKRVADLQQQIQELRKQMGRDDGARVRVEALPRTGVTPRAFKMAPGMTMFSNRPKFGFSMSNVPDSAGVKVTAVTPSSPAEKAGLRSGDIVTLFNGVKLGGLDDPASEVMRQGENIEVGDTIAVEFKHGTERKRVQMVAEDLPMRGFSYSYSDEPGATPEPDYFRMVAPEMFQLGKIPGGWLDVEMVSVNKDLGEYFGATEGVLVVRAPRDSSLGIKGGDVILSIGGRKATSPSQAIRVLRSYENGESFEMTVLRKKARVNVTAKVPERDRGFFWDGARQ